ncbi:HEPN domain-containing protein [uncultured Granulicatella sp.]|uniref:ApeA N-terminal domain 1-containing protein n=1 Tax=uncultured Granulicatella sp. TaxID=316089 RepID=UPI0028DB31A6|nr:HEPN domain-containing protein [uncultured Granulicatella sp.]
MSFKDYVWDKDFELKGYFSDSPGNIASNDSLSGILHYTPQEITLELFGEFPDETGNSFGFSKDLEKIYGFSSDGNVLILNTYGKTMEHISTPGFSIIKYGIEKFKLYNIFYRKLENFHSKPEDWIALIDKLEKEEIMEFRFSFEHIEEWIEKSLVTIKHRENKDIFESSINDYKSTKAVINSLKINFKDIPILHSSYTTTSFRSNYYINFTPADSETKKFNDFYDAALKFNEFIEIISNVPISFTNIEFLVQDVLIAENRIPLIEGKFFVQHARKYKKWNKSSQQNISLSKLDTDFDQILNHWFDKTEELEFIVKQFSKNLHGDLYLEDQLVDAIRNLEVYSRNFQIDENGKPRELTLSKRLKELFTSIDNINQDKIFPKELDRKFFIKKLVDTRNYYTHGDKKENHPKLITDFHEMYDTKVLLQEVLRYFIYKELGMNYNL